MLFISSLAIITILHGLFGLSGFGKSSGFGCGTSACIPNNRTFTAFIGSTLECSDGTPNDVSTTIGDLSAVGVLNNCTGVFAKSPKYRLPLQSTLSGYNSVLYFTSGAKQPTTFGSSSNKYLPLPSVYSSDHIAAVGTVSTLPPPPAATSFNLLPVLPKLPPLVFTSILSFLATGNSALFTDCISFSAAVLNV